MRFYLKSIFRDRNPRNMAFLGNVIPKILTLQVAYTSMRQRSYFWRTTNQAEIDYVEEVDGVISAFEFKWNPKTKVRFPKAFVDAYQPQNTEVIHRNNYWGWLQ